jgi:hypothetical protein
MRKLMIIAAIATVGLIVSARAAHAQEKPTGVGVGVETLLTASIPGTSFSQAPGAATFVYSGGVFHIDALLTFISYEENDLIFGVGGRFFYQVHGNARADFSIGGGLGIIHTDHEPDPQDDETDIHLEIATKLRTFIAPNVAIHAVMGLGIVLADNPGGDRIGLVGQLAGSFGLTYFFF